MVFCFVQNFFFGQHELEYYFFLSRIARNIFPEFVIRLYDKNSQSHYLFSSTNIRIFFSATLGIRIFFLKKNHNPPLQVKWSFPNIYNVVYGVQCTALFSSLQLSHIMCKLSLKSIFILIFDKPVNHKPILSCLHFMLRIYLSNN